MQEENLLQFFSFPIVGYGNINSVIQKHFRKY